MASEMNVKTMGRIETTSSTINFERNPDTRRVMLTVLERNGGGQQVESHFISFSDAEFNEFYEMARTANRG